MREIKYLGNFKVEFARNRAFLERNLTKRTQSKVRKCNFSNFNKKEV